MPDPTDRAATAARHAHTVLVSNRRTGVKDGFAYDFTCPSPTSYPFQWAWDSCFHAIALAGTDAPRAMRELDSLLHGMDADGFLPHMLLWQESLRARAAQDFRMAVWAGWKSVTLAPPVLARAVQRVYVASGDRDWLERILPDVCRFYDWLDAVRGTGSGLLAICQPDESGLDMSPKYDRALGVETGTDRDVARSWHVRMDGLLAAYRPDRRPDSRLGGLRRFYWVDVLFNSIYADSLRRLADLLGEGGAAGTEIRLARTRFAARAAEVRDALLRECWDSATGVFHDLDLVAGRAERMLTISSLFPLILRDLPDAVADRMISEHLTNPDEFWLPYPVPSVAASEPAFDSVFATGAIFRGSTWVNLNWYLYWALRDRGAHDIARTLAERTVAATAAAGMRECYGPYDAVGHGAVSFGWSSLILDLLAAESPSPDRSRHLAEIRVAS